MVTYLHSQINLYRSQSPKFSMNYAKERMKQRLSLQLIKMQLDSGLTLEDFSAKAGMHASTMKRLQSGEHNPTILTLVELAEKCGYEVEVKIKAKS